MSTLFLFSHAGGNVWEYAKMLSGIEKEIRMIPVELPGDASRLMAEPYDDFGGYVKEAHDYIMKNAAAGDDIYLMGHSFGGYLMYELAKSLPVKVSGIVASGCHPYHIYRKPVKGDSTYCHIFGYSKDMPQELIELFEPVIADKIEIVAKHCKGYKNSVVPEVLHIPAEILYGQDDDRDCGSEEWYKYFDKDTCNIHIMNVGHFYWRDDESNIDKMSKIILNLKERTNGKG